MRRILLITLASALVVGAFAGVAAAQLRDTPAAAAQAAPFDVPSAMPTRDAQHPTAFGFRASEALAADLAAEAAPADDRASAAASGGASATVTVTATVLPAITIQLDASGAVDTIIVNTDARSAADVLFLFRDADGEIIADLDAATWDAARAALAQTTAGIGTVYDAAA